MQKPESPDPNSIPRYRAALSWFSAPATAWLIMVVVLAIAEVSYLRAVSGSEMSWLPAIGIAILNAISAWLLLQPFVLLLLIAGWLLSPRVIKPMIIGLLFLHLIGRLLLLTYFSKALVPLGADLYGYSWKDVQQTIGAAGGVPWSSILLMVVLILSQWLLLRFCRKKLRLSPVAPAAAVTIGLMLLLAGWSGINIGRSEFTRNMLMDKFAFFMGKSWEHFFRHDAGMDIYADSYLGDDNTAGAVPHHYIDETAFPFLRSDSTPDVLSSFLTHGNTPPNIVIVLVEGLGRAFTNQQAYLGSFTPFLDSLSRKSLYWENFLSAGGRTFAVLPSLLGSLPFAHNGFLELGGNMPQHFSLVNLLKGNGYHSSFYYGGDARFDNMAPFLRLTGIDELNDEASFPSGYTKIPGANGFTWGYNDHELFRYWLSSRPDNPAPPQLSVLLTVSTHSPFLLNEPEEYHRRFEERMSQLGFSEDGKQEHRKYKDQYASILYTDQAIHDFFAGYAKRKDFNNTIFIITGDHRMPEIPMRDKIDRFHVPLIVYSPLLTRPAQFSSISSHFDITPSLLSWLRHTYGWHLPAEATWIGDGLDTARVFRNIHSYPLMQTKTDMVDYIKGDKHLNNGTLFQLTPGMSEDISPDKDMQQQLSLSMDAWRQRNERWLSRTAILPDSLIQLIRR